VKVRYIGPFDEVEIREFGIVVKRNHQVEVPDAIGEKLTEQADWEEVGKPKSEQPETETDKVVKGG
jgi:hypothetical protein